jgi:hypothetical protein
VIDASNDLTAVLTNNKFLFNRGISLLPILSGKIVLQGQFYPFLGDAGFLALAAIDTDILTMDEFSNLFVFIILDIDRPRRTNLGTGFAAHAIVLVKFRLAAIALGRDRRLKRKLGSIGTKKDSLDGFF